MLAPLGHIPYATLRLGLRGGEGRDLLEWGHEAKNTGLAYAPVSQAHGHHHTQFNVSPCCTAAQTCPVPTVDSHAPLRVAFECTLAVWASGSARLLERGGGGGGEGV